MATQSHCRVAEPEALRSVIKQCRIGDWFVLDLLAKNLDPLNFRDVINDLQLRLDGKGANGIWTKLYLNDDNVNITKVNYYHY